MTTSGSFATALAPSQQGAALAQKTHRQFRVAALRAASNSADSRASTLSLLKSSGPPPGTPRALLLEVHINQQSGHETAMFLSLDPDPDKSLYARGSDLKRWRMHPPNVVPREYAGDKFYPLDAIPGLSWNVDLTTLAVQINAPADAFTGTYIDGLRPKNPPPQPTPPGGFLNYDFLATRYGGNTRLNGLFTLGLFNNWGNGTSSFLGQDIGGGNSRLVRLDTAWRHNNPGAMTTLTLGDSITRGGLTGLALRMGGIRYGSNFATRPYFLTIPLPSVSGEARLPSTVDLYVDGMLKASRNVPPGPFSVPYVPVLTGPGDIRLVVRDALGREHVITTSFYASSRLLKRGLSDYSFSIGALRKNYGFQSNDYGHVASTGLFRHGFSDSFTGQIYGEATEALQNLGMAASFAGVGLGVITAGAAISHGNLGKGALGLLGWQRQWQSFNLAARVQLASPQYSSLGYNGRAAPRRQISATAGAFLGQAGSFSLIYVDQMNTPSEHLRLLNASWSINVGRQGYLSLIAYHTLSGETNNALALTFTLAFGERSSASFGLANRNGQMQGVAQVQQSLPVGTGFGYRASVQAGPNALNQAQFAYRNSVGTWRVGVQNAGGRTGWQAEASGGLALLDGQIFAMRNIDGAFGVVEVPGIGGVTVYADNHPVAITDENGYALIPRMRPYQYNSIRLSAENLPLSAQVPTLELVAVPRQNSAVLVKFPITTTRGATLTVVRKNGKPVPAGATARITGQVQKFPVGLDGMVYLTGLSEHNTVEVMWNQHRCVISFNMPKSDDPLPDLGSYTCNDSQP